MPRLSVGSGPARRNSTSFSRARIDTPKEASMTRLIGRTSLALLLALAPSTLAQANGQGSCEPSWLPTFGGSSSVDGIVFALAVFDDGGGPALYAGGDFHTAGGVPAGHIAKWDGSAWSPLGSGMNDYVLALTVFDDGSGPALYAGGWFNSAGGAYAGRVAKWDGSTWSSLGSGVNGPVRALGVFDDGGGPALFAGGEFFLARGAPAGRIAKWDGATWSSLGGITGGFFPAVNALAAFDDGSGPALYVGGQFTSAGGTFANNIAKWNGASWSGVGGLNSYPNAFEVFDDGSGPALYAGGSFSSAGGVSANGVAKWNGSTWSSLGSGTDALVRSFAAFDDGAGPALYAAGYFELAGGIGAEGVARWDGASWSPLGSGTDGKPLALAAFDDGLGGGAALHVGGNFVGGFDSGDSYLAKWGCPNSITPVPGCFGNPATLAAPGPAQIGQPLTVALQGASIPDGLASLFAGLGTSDATGCGLPLPGFGELLLSTLPPPILLLQQPTVGGSGVFALSVPANPNLVGVTVMFQAVNIGVVPVVAFELSTGLSVRFVP